MNTLKWSSYTSTKAPLTLHLRADQKDDDDNDDDDYDEKVLGLN